MTQATFDRRLGALAKKHRRMAEGVTYRLGRDGLITAQPRRRLPRFPLRSLLLLLAAAFAFKAFLLASLGADTYLSRLDRLADGNLAEQAGAWAMAPDPVTVALADGFRAILR